MTAKAKKADGATVYTREALLKSKRFAGCQQDFLAAVLDKPEYTLAEAEAAVKAFFGEKAVNDGN